MTESRKILETERLTLQQFTLEQAGFILELLNSPGWLQYIGDRGVSNIEDAKKHIVENLMTSYAQYGYGFYAVSLKNSEQTIGGCGLIRRDGLDHPDIGFALLPAYIGQGYAYEMALATLNYAQEELGLSKVLGITLPENKASVRLLKKIGLSFEEMVRLPADDKDLMLFSVSFE